MVSKKKIRFEHVKVGKKFKFGNILCIKDYGECAVNLKSGKVYFKRIKYDTLVTPVKIKMEIIK